MFIACANAARPVIISTADSSFCLPGSTGIHRLLGGDWTGWLGRQDSNLCIRNLCPLASLLSCLAERADRARACRHAPLVTNDAPTMLRVTARELERVNMRCYASREGVTRHGWNQMHRWCTFGASSVHAHAAPGLMHADARWWTLMHVDRSRLSLRLHRAPRDAR